MFDITIIILLIAGLLVVIAAIQPLAVKLKVSPAVLLAGVGVAIGLVSGFLLRTPLTNAFDEVAAPIVHLPVNSSTFVNVFLPLLLFQAAITIEVRRMIEDAGAILLLAVVAVLVASAVVGVTLSWLFGVSLLAALMLGAIVATTDPAAVVAIFRDIGAPARLCRLVEGEALLNDAAAIAVFGVVLGMLTRRGEPDLSSAAERLALLLLGGGILGAAAGRLVVAALPWLGGIRAAEATLTLAAPYLVFIVGDHVLDVSGVVAVVAMGLVIGASGPSALSPDSWRHLQHLWEQIAFWAGSLIFMLAALLVPRLMSGLRLVDVAIIMVAVAAALVARAMVLYGLLPLLGLLRLGQRVSGAYKTAILWGGLRGAVTLALALAAVENPKLSASVKHFVGVTATGFVLFTLFVNGTTLRRLVARLGLDRLSPSELMLRDKVVALALAEVRDSVLEAGRRYDLSTAAIAPVTDHYDRRAAEVPRTTEERQAEALSQEERLAVALVTLANRERGLVLGHHGQHSASPGVIARLLRHADRIVDRTRSHGSAGYRSAAGGLVAFSATVRLSHLLYQYGGIDLLLTRQVTTRFETLMVERLVVEELRHFVPARMSPLFGEDVATILEEIVGQRLYQTEAALEALRLQFPDYAEALEARFLRRLGQREELAHYDLLREEGLLDHELHHNLRRLASRQVAEPERRHRLDLKLNRNDMTQHLPLLDGLDRREAKRLLRQFKPRFAVPGEVVIPRQSSAALYFVASGAVEVRGGKHPRRLGRGEFISTGSAAAEPSGLADVVALTYCSLLVLPEAEAPPHLAQALLLAQETPPSAPAVDELAGG